MSLSQYPKNSQSYVDVYRKETATNLLFLLWKEGEHVDRKDKVGRKKTFDKIVQDAIDIICSPEARNDLQFIFLTKLLTELSRHQLFGEQHRRHQLFEALNSVSLAMIKSVGEHKLTMQDKEWVSVARTSFIYSSIDELRFLLLKDEALINHFKEINSWPLSN